MGSYLPVTDRDLAGPLSSPVAALAAGAGKAEHRIPDYLNEVYWWTYVHPRAVRFFERQWLVNLILWGKYVTMRDATLAEMGDSLPGRTLQVACADAAAGRARAGRLAA
jgi:hypothetical protein